MTPLEPYKGAVSLASSKYASPARNAPIAAMLPSLSHSPKTAANGTTAIEEQIAVATSNAASEMATQNSDALLAMSRNEVLKEEVDKHSLKFSKSVSIAVTNTRKLLELIRTSIKKDDNDSVSGLETVNYLWRELEELFHVAQEAESALPAFLEKQKDNMSLYHNSMMNEAIRYTQDELNLQHKKVNIQHSLILEHQQAFQEYKTQTDSKLKELAELHERASRLVLDKGLLRTEVDKLQQQLEQANTMKSEDIKRIGELQKELETLISTKKALLEESETLRKVITNMQESSQIKEKKITDNYEKQIRDLTVKLGKEGEKQVALNTLVNALRGGETPVRKENDKLKEEYKALQGKFKDQSDEFSKVFSNLNEQNKKVGLLSTDIKQLQKENTDLKQRLSTLEELEKTNCELSRAHSALQEHVKELKVELTDAKDEAARGEKEAMSLSQKLKKAEKENEELEMENNELVGKKVEYKKISAACTILKGEKAKLTATVEELQSKLSAQKTSEPVASSTCLEKEKAALESKLREAEEKLIDTERALEEWALLAKKSYKEYKDMYPIYKEADNYRKDVLQKNQQIQELQLQLSQAQSSQPNGVDTGGDMSYWKDKYESLLAAIGD